MKQALKEIITGCNSLFVGMRITLGQFFKRSVTLQYPHESIKMFPRYRGHIELVGDPATGKPLCIACKACEKACPCDAIHVIDNLAVIDYAKCQNCGQCVKVCPKSTIYDMRHARDERHAREGRTAPVEEPAAPACKCSDAPRE